MKTVKAFKMESRLVPILPEKKVDKIPGGFYLKARCIQNSAIAGAPPHVREIWDWLIKEAKYKSVSFSGTSLVRGQLFTDYAEIQEGLSWKEGFIKKTYQKHHVDYAMRWLREKEMITTQKTTRGLFITICKYDYYQNPTNYENATDYDTDKVTTPQTTPQTTMITTEEPIATTLFPIVCEEKKGNDYDSAKDTANDMANDTVNKEGKESKELKRESGDKSPKLTPAQFYQNEIEANNEADLIGKYKNFIAYLNGNNPEKIVFKRVMKLEDQLTYGQYVVLREKVINNEVDIYDVLKAMENTKGLEKERSSLYLTMNSWSNVRINGKKK